MHAVVFEVAVKPGIDPTVANAELDKMIGQVKTLPGFIRGIWTTDGTTGLSFQLYADEDVAQQLVRQRDRAPRLIGRVPLRPDVHCHPRHRRARLIFPAGNQRAVERRKPRDQRYRWSRMGEDDHVSAPSCRGRARASRQQSTLVR